MVVVCSSTGDGDPPENAARFVRLISRRSLPSNFLSNLTYALLGKMNSKFINSVSWFYRPSMCTGFYFSQINSSAHGGWYASCVFAS